jgi:glycosyltransferase involved in cell wall biosynthesis
MKVCVFHNLSGGGSVRVLNNTINDIKKDGNSVDVYTITEKDRGSWLNIKEKQYTIKINPPKNLFLRMLWTIFSLPKKHHELAIKINSLDYDIVVVHHDYFTKSPYILRYLERQSIYFLHEPPREFAERKILLSEGLKSLLVNIIRLPVYFVDKENVKKASVIVANSYYSKSVIKNYYKRESKVYYPRIDRKVFVPMKKDRDIVLLIGGLNGIKGHDFVLKSLKKTGIKNKVVIVGDGTPQYCRYLKSFEDKNTNIELINGHVTDEELSALYNRSIIHCIGAICEPFGLTSIESQACGTPVVAVSEGGLTETIKENSSGYTSPRDTALFANKILRAINRSKGMRAECIANSKKFISDFDITKYESSRR